MKTLVCLLFFPAALAVWVLGSPGTAWRVITAFRRRGRDGQPSSRPTDTLLRVFATLALASIVVLLILATRGSD